MGSWAPHAPGAVKTMCATQLGGARDLYSSQYVAIPAPGCHSPRPDSLYTGSCLNSVCHQILTGPSFSLRHNTSEQQNIYCIIMP